MLDVAAMIFSPPSVALPTVFVLCFTLFSCLMCGNLMTKWVRKHASRQVKNLPGPTHYPFVGSAIDVFVNRHRLHDWIAECHLKYGQQGLFTVSVPGSTEIHICDPKLVEFIFKFTSSPVGNMSPRLKDMMTIITGSKSIFTLEGDEWLNRRKLLSHLFSTRAMRANALPSFQEETDLLVDHFE
eukprot:995987_1